MRKGRGPEGVIFDTPKNEQACTSLRVNNCLIKIVWGCSLCGVLSLKRDSCLNKTVQRCSPCGVRVVIEKGVFSETVLRHHRSAFTAGQLLGDNNAWAVKGIILQCTDLMSKSWDIPLKIPVFARIAS